MRFQLPRIRPLALVGFGSALTISLASAAAAPTVGSPNTVTADPPVTVPRTTPCVVPLFANLSFNGFTPQLFSFAPPAACPGPWAKVVLAADFSIDAGRQFDRTASIWLGGANLYFGTTAEPSRAVGPSWHIENDLTDYGALFASPQPGMVQLDNLVNDTFTSVLHGSAELRFYPVERGAVAPASADAVFALSNGPTGGAVGLATTASSLSRTFTLPTNIERVVLDVYAQSQSGDEFWYTCVPDDLTGPLQSCGGTGFREAEISVDGKPAGVAPVYPWIYTGGIDPDLWRPIPGVQTLDFTPYRVDLTPFAGALSDGQPHTVAVSVFNADNFFATTATLLVFEDHKASHVHGAVTIDTLAAAPTPAVTSNIATAADGTISGPVAVTSSRKFIISGFADTSHGRVTTTVTGEIQFANRQQFNITAAQYHQQIKQTTTIATTTATDQLGRHAETFSQLSWPLSVDFLFASNADGSGAQTTQIDQRFERSDTDLVNGLIAAFHILSNHVSPADTLNFDATGVVTSATGQTSSQQFFSADGRGNCFSRDLTASAGVLTSVTDGKECGR